MNQATHFKNLAIVMVTWALGLIASGYSPADRITWVLEVLPAFIAFAFMWPTRKSFPLSPMLCTLIAIHGPILMRGCLHLCESTAGILDAGLVWFHSQ